jgi:hypothetical protein
MRKIIFTSLCSLLVFSVTMARENVNSEHRDGPGGGGDHTFANCLKSTAQTDLDINNIRTKIFINGDMWWDLVGTATYEIPKGSGKHSLFAGAVWVGGYDNSGQLRVAAQTYRQSGEDFWPGPVNLTTTDVTPSVCTKFDRHFRVNREDVQEAISHFSKGAYPVGYTPPQVMQDWPGNGDNADVGAGPGYVHFLAPFFDNNNDGEYHWEDGDYPWFEFNSSTPVCDDRILGDQSLWWVFNDVGNVHKETDSPTSIGLEIQAQAFAFATNDEINNMSFYKYKIINRNTTTNIDSCFFGAWVDPDLGNYLDDYVGCDVSRGFGYCYNGDQNDEGIAGYGINPPAVGYDFFQGPAADTSDGIDNDRDSCIDCTFKTNAAGGKDTISDKVQRELIIMSKFVYYNNNNDPVNGNPVGAEDYYGYLRGIWRNGNAMTYGGNGHGGGPGATSDRCDFMFPGNSDPNHWGTNGLPEADWDEVAAGNQPDDRRFLQSAGPFTLLPGAVNYITTGAVWARATNGGPAASVRLVRQADDYAQALFDNCFKVVDGPDAPDVTIRELNNELIFAIDNSALSNNYKEEYSEIDPNTAGQTYYKFEGYEIFQTVDPFVTVSDVHNADKARLIFQCDLRNGVSQIVNNYFDESTQGWVPREEVNGTDNGLRHTFRVTTDLFAAGDPALVNHKTYYYIAVAYAYNVGESADDPYIPAGRNQPFKSGRKNIKVYTAIPHSPSPEVNGTELGTSYGDGPEITRIQGTGNGYQIASGRGSLDLVQDAEYNKLFSAPYFINHPTYARAHGPVDIQVYDPVAVEGGDFGIWLAPVVTTSRSDAFHDSTLYQYPDSSMDTVWVDVAHTIVDHIIVNYFTSYVVQDTLWILKNNTTNRIDTSLKSISLDKKTDPNKYQTRPYDQLFPNYGLSINMTQTLNPGQDPTGGAGYVEGTIEFQNPLDRWLTGVHDLDNSPYDWIASGKAIGTYGDYSYTTGKAATGDLDGSQTWEKILGGSWTPYKFAAIDTVNRNGLAWVSTNGQGQYTGIKNIFSNTASVDVVITSDRSKWSRCVVLEEETNPAKAIGGALRLSLRKSPSLDQNYNQQADSGFSYFPGYAVNVETGERLNIAFGEDSYYGPSNGWTTETGQDMKWNPTSSTSYLDLTDNTFKYILGGRHAIYVFDHNANMPAYDGCDSIGKSIKYAPASVLRDKLWASCMWVGFPLLEPGSSIPVEYTDSRRNDARVRLRVTKPYKAYSTDNGASADSLPYYTFSTFNLVPKTHNAEAAKSALDLINVVPNPYYAYSQYEKNQLDYKVKIVNLPSKCTVSIFTPSGTLVRKFKRDVASDNTSGGIYDPKADLNLESSVDWDLKNSTGIPVASGLYLIHVEVPNVGERTIKFFGVLRPIDLDTF